MSTDVLEIWSGTGVPPDSEEWTWHEQAMQPPGTSHPDEMVRNVVVPTLTRFKPPEGTANGTAIIVAPGGGFHFLMMYHEGYDVARWLTKFGVTAFVLKYRVQHTPEDDSKMSAFLEEFDRNLPAVTQTEVDPPMNYPPLEEARLWSEEDGRQAIRFLRQNAAELGINPNRIGIMGFSAGGGVAINSILEHDAQSYPDFAAGIYPAYRIVKPMPKAVPPLFIVMADDDNLVAPISSARLYEDGHKAGQSVELHIFANGGHGFGMHKQGLLSDIWVNLFENWLRSQGYIA
ncbi:MAG: alpha/beta hydrolase [Ardenticatenaceae bacterium]|nr:alpha/beta hydrolase [Ardenticatenaceae bacterium]MCB9445880.1 alpha/beta hydrolase [Ardenticatenaceae bacterium]